MTQLAAQAHVRLPAPEDTLTRLGEHVREHGFQFQRDGADWALSIHDGCARIRVDGERLDIRIEAATLDALHDLKVIVASHVLEFSPQASEIRWQGDGSQLRESPAFRVLRVIAARDLTPRMRRITLAGERLERYAGLTNLHCKLLLPQPGDTAPEWPTLADNGLPRMPEGDKRLDARTYTIRHIDLEAGTLDIDMVVHEPAGPGGSWAQRARPGDLVGMRGPGGLGAREADWTLLAGDETALPAIARILENLPASARGVALIEVQDDSGRLELRAPAGIELRWLLRGAHAPGTTTLLADGVRAVAWPEAGTRLFVWAGLEFDAFRAVRGYLRKERGLSAAEHLVVAYWRRGRSETEFKHAPESD
ncbi:siderophore-interacting protein [Thauera linaloolentis]|uniref:FAD-binding 9 siderophore-interacting domain-containing protein n=1 Tax=Thauera linaloolentis (strain DSM 12138 / JCM 21573 / CCUG 41526 / CIP 105981 / IAM 15112 / NBRC 102519 / 47Lol) TaxID=1123367 RepID=N6Y2C9_THAL4|nr:siderophore-interacting protein [Thauera linaloolentis]ENO88331.1 FAD-binding 9 siderophore-interacting domain-containing protein [Thauera linaloolentis 47Lol = DSM 12138]MCM8564460.1 siderophore-interacting protein [Thauera linaloolentis]